jgi:hypothetical protein
MMFDQLHVPLVFGSGIKQLKFPGANRLFTELTLHNLETFGDFLIVHRGAVAAQ